MRSLPAALLVTCATLALSGAANAQSGRAGSATGTTGGSSAARGVVITPGAVPRGGVQVPTARRPSVPPGTGTGTGWANAYPRGLGDGFAYRYGSIRPRGSLPAHGTLRQTPLGVVIGSGSAPLHPSHGGYPLSGAVIYVQPAREVYTSASYGAWVPGAPVWGADQPPRMWEPGTTRQSCAVVVVLDRNSRGWWQEVTLPLAGAQNVDELQRVLAARLEEGTAFRVRDAAGEWLDIPPRNSVERIVVEPCTA